MIKKKIYKRKNSIKTLVKKVDQQGQVASQTLIKFSNGFIILQMR